MAGKYDGLAKVIIQNVGGRENIVSAEHCFTRLRFVLKDEKNVNEEMLKNTDGIINIIKSGGQFQIVIGTHVPDVYEAVLKAAHLEKNTQTESDEKKGIIDTISGVFMPVIGLLCACGIVKGLLVLLTTAGVLTAESGTYQILYAVGDCIFYFFPVILGYTAAKKFKCSEIIGIAVGCTLIYPAIISLMSAEPIMTIFEGTVLQSSVYAKFLGIPVILNNYSSTVIPVILTVWFASKIEHVIKKHCPAVVKSFGVPFVTLIITIPIAFIIIGPAATWISNIIGWIVEVIYKLSPALFGLFVGGFWQVFVIFGVHQGLTPIVLNNLATNGYDVIFAATCAGCFTQVAILAAIIIKTKNRNLRTTSLSALFSGIFGITEPAIYGVTLPLKMPFIISCVTSGIAGAIAVAGGTKYYNMGGQGIFCFTCYMNPDGSSTSLIWSLIAVGIAMIISFAAMLILYKDKEKTGDTKLSSAAPEKESEEHMSIGCENYIDSPVEGEVIALSEVNDEAFSSGALGEGAAVRPSKGVISAPADGTVEALYPTGHAIGLLTKNGAEILIHIGIDTVKMNGRGFKACVKSGDSVKKGQKLIEFDIHMIESEGYDTVVPVVITNSDDYKKITAVQPGDIQAGGRLMTLEQ